MSSLRLDLLALVGCALAFAAVVGGNQLEGGRLSSLLNLPAAVIVLGGTLGAVILQTPWRRLNRSVRLLRWLYLPPRTDSTQLIKRLSEWARRARKEGLVGLEDTMDAERDPFIAKGLALVIDAGDIGTIRRALDLEMDTRLKLDLAAASVFRAMGGYAPTIGILGAVLGLIQVMENLTDPSALGRGIATAFIATIYGVGFANLLFLPIADRLRAVAMGQAEVRRAIAEGLVAIAQGEHPRSLGVRLRGLLDETDGAH